MSSSRIVFGEGPANAKLMIVGEALGKKEEELGRPFVGPSGEILEDLLAGAGLKRSCVYITNVVKIRPPDNDLSRLNEIPNPSKTIPLTEAMQGFTLPEDEGKMFTPGYEIEDFLPLLWKEVAVLKPNCILGLGAIALQYLTGKSGNGAITNWRGSILPALDARPTKCVCTYHPASLFERPREGSKSSGEGMFAWKQKAIIQFDFKRAVEQSKFPEIRRPARFIKACRNSLDLSRFLSEYSIR